MGWNILLRDENLSMTARGLMWCRTVRRLDREGPQPELLKVFADFRETGIRRGRPPPDPSHVITSPANTHTHAVASKSGTVQDT